jgi:poly-gamma-glutamate capsule biosynthesis protein CapA/YwtB (metallophosphatase superfamily)
VSEVRLNAVGDVWFGDHPVRIGHGVASLYRRRGADFLFGPSAASFKHGELNFCNLESVLSDAGRRAWWLPSVEMRGPPEGAAALRRAGFNVVSVANNHMMQHGSAAFTDTMDRLCAAGIDAAGVDYASGLSRPVERDINGQRVCIVAFSMRPEQYFEGQPLYSQRHSEAQILEEVAGLRARGADHLICSLHWGTEYMSRPEAAQIRFARQLIDSGVSVILGHHAHVLQGWEYHGNGLILYSLGNFVFDLWPRDTRKSVIAHIALARGRRPALHFTPIWITDHYQPVVAEGACAEEILGDMQRLAGQVSGALEADPAEYRREARRAESQVQRAGYEYFARNLWRYSANMLAQSVGRTVLRRLSGR